MTGRDHHHRRKAHLAVVDELARIHHEHVAKTRDKRRGRRRLKFVGRRLRTPLVRRLLWGSAATVVVLALMVLGLWWRLNAGPIELDMATPFLKAAIEDNFGGDHTVSVGGTQIERDEKGRTSLRLRDIVVRDADGTVVASAPKAEVGISGVALLTGHLRAQSLNLVGAEMSIRIETDGRVTVFAGADKRPIVTASPPARPPSTAPAADAQTPQEMLRKALEDVAGGLAWIDSLGETGLDGHDLRELGLKNGHLVVEDQRNGKRWTFDRINASLTRPHQGGVTFKLESDNPQHPWVISAAMRPLSDGIRAVGLEARKVNVRDILLALRLTDADVEADLPLSASIRADITADGTPQSVQGQVIAGAGAIRTDLRPETVPLAIDHADIRFEWDDHRHRLLVPFQIQSGGNQFTMRATLDAPTDDSGVWQMTLARSDPVIDPIILAGANNAAGAGGAAAKGGDEEGVSLNRVNLRARIDLVHSRIDLEQGDLRRIDTRPLHNIGIAVTGSLDFSGADPRLTFGIAGTRMPVATMKRLWPVFVAVNVRQWVEEHITGGTVERVLVAGNAALPEFDADGPPMPDEGLSVDVETSGTTLRPVDKLPPIRDADLTVHVTGSTARVDVGRGTVEVAPGRKLAITGGVFRMPDTHPKPAPAQATFRVDGSLPAVTTLLASDTLKDSVAVPLDPSSSRGTVSAQVKLDFSLSKEKTDTPTQYAIAADITNFTADKLLMGQKVEAALLKVNATNSGYQVDGDIKINGMAATVDLDRRRGDPDGTLHLAASLDEAARRKLGIDLGSGLTGAIPIKLTARFGGDAKDEPMNVEADLTPVKIDNLLPGWVKAAGRPARATFTLTKTAKAVRFDDLSIDGSGATVKGSIELDASNEIQSVNLPVFALSDGDKATLKADRAADGTLKVTVRGDVYDGRNFVKSSLAGAPDKGKSGRKSADLDLDVKLGAVAGHNGETLRGLDLKLTRRDGHIRNFSMSAKIGHDAPLNGDLRLRARDHHQVIYFETSDAGALFRFTDLYPRMVGGQMWVAMDPPSDDSAPQAGTLYIGNFTVRGEPALERAVTGAGGMPGQGRGSIEFTELRADFTRFPGKMAIRDGVVRGPTVGATIEGQIDYVRDDVHLRGTFVPFYGLNNMFGQIPIVGLFLGGGSNEGLVGITYEAVGPPNAPRITVNPVSAIAPGLLRKFIPSPGAFDPQFSPPSR